MRAAVLTISDKASRGEREDRGGPAVREALAAGGFEVVREIVLPDERRLIRDAIATLCDGDQADLVVTTGGTGFSPRDVTPEATQDVIQRQAPGIAEAMRAAGLSHTPFAILSRAVAGIRGRTLVINLPGNPQGAVESLQAVIEAVRHGIEILKGEAGEHGA